MVVGFYIAAKFQVSSPPISLSLKDRNPGAATEGEARGRERRKIFLRRVLRTESPCAGTHAHMHTEMSKTSQEEAKNV